MYYSCIFFAKHLIINGCTIEVAYACKLLTTS